MEIVSSGLKRTDMSKSIDEIDEMYLDWNWDKHNDWVEADEFCFKWDDDFTNDLVKLAKIGVEGELVTRGEEGEYTKFVLEGGEVKEYYGDVVFPEEPNEVHKEIKQSVVVTEVTA